MLEQCCNHSKQCGNNVATLCCSKNRRRESSRVTSPLRQSQLCENIHCAKQNSLQVHLAVPGAVLKLLLNEPTLGLISLLRAQESGSKFYGQCQSTVI